MQTQRRAVIDVGTNSIKLLVADVEGGRVQPVLEQSKQTRLGRGFYPAQRLQPKAIAATAQAVAHFAGTAKSAGAVTSRVIATSAARDAINREELIKAIHDVAGLTVEVIAGEKEADLVFRGVSTDPDLTTQRLLILDVGGGSSEFILGEAGKKIYAASVPLGSVRLLEMLTVSDPPSEREFSDACAWVRNMVDTRVRPNLQPLRAGNNDVEPRLMGVGGAASILARIEHSLPDFNREVIDATRLGRGRVNELTRKLWSLPLNDRRKIIGLPPNRADVLLMGTVIFLVIMEAFDFTELRVSTRGLRFAAVLDE